jgi:hypothetical protein
MKRQYVPLLLAALAAVHAPGCSSGPGLSSPYSSGPRDMMTSRWRDHVWANRAYQTRLADSADQRAYESDFRRGFLAGYQSVSQGGDGTIPAMPPRLYWGSQYLSPEGQAKAKSWFDGYPEGVRAAQADGIDAYRDIYVSQLLEDIERTGPGMQPSMGRHMLDMPVDERLAPPAQPEWVDPAAPPKPIVRQSPTETATPDAAIAPVSAQVPGDAEKATTPSASPIPTAVNVNPRSAPAVFHASPESPSATGGPVPVGFVDFATYEAAPRMVPGHQVPVLRGNKKP